MRGGLVIGARIVCDAIQCVRAGDDDPSFAFALCDAMYGMRCNAMHCTGFDTMRCTRAGCIHAVQAVPCF
jgi:hypothetical protein